MKPTRRVILFSLLATIVACLAIYLLRPAEPSYLGQAVPDWTQSRPIQIGNSSRFIDVFEDLFRKCPKMLSV